MLRRDDLRTRLNASAHAKRRRSRTPSRTHRFDTGKPPDPIRSARPPAGCRPGRNTACPPRARRAPAGPSRSATRRGRRSRQDASTAPGRKGGCRQDAPRDQPAPITKRFGGVVQSSAAPVQSRRGNSGPSGAGTSTTFGSSRSSASGRLPEVRNIETEIPMRSAIAAIRRLRSSVSKSFPVGRPCGVPASAPAN